MHTPDGESSMTITGSDGCRPSFSAATRYGSGKGLARSHSSPSTTTSNACRRCRAVSMSSMFALCSRRANVSATRSLAAKLGQLLRHHVTVWPQHGASDMLIVSTLKRTIIVSSVPLDDIICPLGVVEGHHLGALVTAAFLMPRWSIH